MISQKALDAFKLIWKKEYGEEISNEFALTEAIALLTIINMTYRPIKKEWVDEVEGKLEEKSNSP